MKTPSLISALTLLTSSFCLAGGEGWTSDFEAAKAQAKKENKDLLIDFTGSDWCGWCIRLREEVFEHDPFKKGVADKFVLVELDYPRDKSKLSEETIKQNEELKNKYEPQGYPTILLTDADGIPYAQTGYQQGGPDAYVKHLDELRTVKTEMTEGFKAAESLKGVEKAKKIVETLGKVEPHHYKHYDAKIAEIKKLDPKDSTGFQKEQDFRVASNKLQESIQSAMRSQKPDDALKAIDDFIAKHELAGEGKQEILAQKVNLYMAQKKIDDAKKVLEEIISIDDKTELGASAKGFIPRLEGMKKQMEAQMKAENEKTEEATKEEK